MGYPTNIPYCHATFSPWLGCQKCSVGCANCFALRFAHKMGLKPGERRLTSDTTWRQPLRWEKALATGRVWNCGVCGGSSPDAYCEACGALVERQDERRVLIDLCDWLDEQVPAAWLARFLGLIAETPHLKWMLLTKRPQEWRDRIQMAGIIPVARNWLAGTPPSNVWLGITTENQGWLTQRASDAMKIPAPHIFVSVEPLLGPLDLRPWLDKRNPDGSRVINLVIIGGMNGPGWEKWPMQLKWVEDIVAQCDAAGVPPFVKQDAGPRPGMQGRIPNHLWARKELPA